MNPMNFEPDVEGIGEVLGQGAADRVLDLAESYADCERERIELTCNARVEPLRAELFFLSESERDLKERIRGAPLPGERKRQRRKALYYWAITSFLAGAGFFFSLVAFDPYRLGWKSYLYCLGIAIVTPFCVEYALEKWESARLIKILSAVAATAAVLSLVLLAVIRGDVLAQQMGTMNPVVIISQDAAQPLPPHNSFYEQTLFLLRLVMAFLAVAMELGAGLALREARSLGQGAGENREMLANELRLVQQRMLEIVSEMSILKDSGSIFLARFWRDFYGSMLARSTRNAIKRVFLPVLLLFLCVPRQVNAAQHTNLVIAIDLSASSAVTDQNHESEFQKNVAGVTAELAQVPAGATVTAIGITESSFSQPDVILSAHVPDDEGYFKERLAAAREQLVTAWRERATRLEPKSQQTDVLGALMIAGELLQSPPADRKVIVVFSDMRQATFFLNLEAPKLVSANSALLKVENHKMLPDLSTTDVYALGVDSAGKSIDYWQSLCAFWRAYFERTGAHLSRYSVLRDVPAF
jgi:hypothetical protein